MTRHELESALSDPELRAALEAVAAAPASFNWNELVPEPLEGSEAEYDYHAAVGIIHRRYGGAP